MSVSFKGFNENIITFKAESGVASGNAVKMSGSGTVSACSDGDIFCGFAVDCGSGYAAVQLCGAVTANYSGTAPGVGYSALVSDSSGVKASESGREYLVVAVDESTETVTFIM